jgi:hypothetical protein
MADTVAECVAAGVALLDERRPGWEQLIDLERLNLGSSCRCILGQLWAGAPGNPYERGRDAIGLVWPATIRYGFDAGSPYDYEALTGEWCRVITARREATS